MNRSAHVLSIDAIRTLRGALQQFEVDAREALAGVALEVRRAVDWLENDRRRYWPEQVRRASEKVIQARNDLERCQLKYGSEEAPSCYEQKKALEKAKRRLAFCEQRLKATRKWIRHVRQELDEFDGALAKMTNCVDADLPRAVAALERMISALDKYADAPPPDMRGAPADTPDVDESK